MINHVLPYNQFSFKEEYWVLFQIFLSFQCVAVCFFVKKNYQFWSFYHLWCSNEIRIYQNVDNWLGMFTVSCYISIIYTTPLPGKFLPTNYHFHSHCARLCRYTSGVQLSTRHPKVITIVSIISLCMYIHVSQARRVLFAICRSKI